MSKHDIENESFQEFIEKEGYSALDEGFFSKDSYLSYKKRVLKHLARFGIEIAENSHRIEDWIRDFFIDKMDELDCAVAIRDSALHFESMSVNEALKILKENGYTLENLSQKEIRNTPFHFKKSPFQGKGLRQAIYDFVKEHDATLDVITPETSPNTECLRVRVPSDGASVTFDINWVAGSDSDIRIFVWPNGTSKTFDMEDAGSIIAYMKKWID